MHSHSKDSSGACLKCAHRWPLLLNQPNSTIISAAHQADWAFKSWPGLFAPQKTPRRARMRPGFRCFGQSPASAAGREFTGKVRASLQRLNGQQAADCCSFELSPKPEKMAHLVQPRALIIFMTTKATGSSSSSCSISNSCSSSSSSSRSRLS